jgi:ubiquinone/menaquinone biosynthesis C-methylase UbiE
MPNEWSKTYNLAERLLWQNPEEVLAQIGLQPGQTLIDLGCGDGFFTIPAARLAGLTGSVYALDASPEAIAIVERKAAQEKLRNVKIELGDAEAEVLCPRCADVVLLANVLHDFAHPLKVLANARQMLKPSGILADLDWKKEPQQMHGPPFPKRLSQDEATAMLAQAGFKVFRDALSGPFHYLLLARAA